MSGEPCRSSDRFAGARIPDSGFAGDDGSAAPGLGAALAAYAGGEATYAEALAVLQQSRLLVPVVAVLGEVDVRRAGSPTTSPATWRPCC